MSKEYICANCGHYYPEKPDDEICITCFSDSVVDAEYAEQLMPNWEDDEY